jgi:hypothetical protein
VADISPDLAIAAYGPIGAVKKRLLDRQGAQRPARGSWPLRPAETGVAQTV